jgi:hypothetical protein
MDGGGGRLPVDGNCGRPPADGRQGGRPWDRRTCPDVRRTRPWTSGRVTTLVYIDIHIYKDTKDKSLIIMWTFSCLMPYDAFIIQAMVLKDPM